MGKNAGRSGGRWRVLRANQAAKRLPCWICEQPINYNAGPDNDDSFSVDHFKPRSTHRHLAEEPSNLRSAHLRCNKSRGDRDVKPGLGFVAQTW
ncbi:HNH endonuclease [Arthrobacter sp. PsM3]|uniref:HNH endonuclease n=1 Tax=Arthrobacter sp. PsM3 TaxID=3030531 RepID=UPI00263B1737|nr:HNH endonuclease [Arthrobacter sp. PsM3]MDN4645373.1 HNH endonuclease [Arthrobacter sp. PsM3]